MWVQNAVSTVSRELIMKEVVPFVRKIANVEDECTCESYEVFLFRAVSGDLRQVRIERAHSQSISHVRRELLKSNAALPSDDWDATALVRHAVEERTPARYLYAAGLGWRPDRRGFVLPDETLGPEKILPPMKIAKGAESRFSCAGTLKAWQDRVATPAAESSRLMFMIVAAFAAPLMRYSGLDNFGVNLFGLTPREREAAALVASSVSGRNPDCDFSDWWGSPSLLLDDLRYHTDLLFLATGVSPGGKYATPAAKYARLRQMRSGDLRAVAAAGRWHGLFLCLLDHAHAEGDAAPGADAILDLGAFNGVSGLALRATTATPCAAQVGRQRALRDLQRHATRQFGHPIRAYLKYLIKIRRTLDSVAVRHRRVFRRTVLKSKLHATSMEVRRFSLLYSAGALAIDAKVLPWSRDQLTRALLVCLETVVQRRRALRMNGKKLRAILSKRLQEPAVVLRRAGDSFGPEQRTGFYRVVDGEKIYTVHAARFRSWFERPLQCCDGLLWLHRHGLLVPPTVPVAPSRSSTQWAERTLRWPDSSVQRSVVFRMPRPSARGLNVTLVATTPATSAIVQKP